jgi:ectoine hydroxylase-related dioxygenase (phytanoyl-CoA dioxygenase family)
MEPTLLLTDDQIEFYRREGYLALGPLTDDAELARLSAIYDDLFARRVGREQGDQFDLAGTDEEGKAESLPQILGPHRFAPQMLEGQLFANAQAIARQLLGPETTFGGDHAIYKAPHTNVPTPWHQDEAYWDPSIDPQVISIWVPLQPANVENGCMWFLPGSHRLEVLTHHSIGHDPRVHGLELAEGHDVDLSKAVACPLPAGGATIHASRTMHYTGPNLSDTPRRAWILTFSAPALPRTDGRRFPWNEIKQTARLERAKANQPG